ncbi:MAG: hypothetical protein HRU12_05715 [Phaeodactylibacter sp.]|nr:hypothetical protein [Phaeodactylibacter sp.]
MQELTYIHNKQLVAGIVYELEAYMHSSARNYVERTDVQLPVVLIDFGFFSPPSKIITHVVLKS